MPEETMTELSYANRVDFYALDANDLRVSIIQRYAHILYGDLMRGNTTPSLSICREINSVTFSNYDELTHLKSRIERAIKYHQTHRTCEPWKPYYKIESVKITAEDEWLRLQVTATKQ